MTKLAVFILVPFALLFITAISAAITGRRQVPLLTLAADGPDPADRPEPERLPARVCAADHLIIRSYEPEFAHIPETLIIALYINQEHL